MKTRKISKSTMAKRLDTSRSQLDRLLDPKKRQRHAQDPGESGSRDRQAAAHRPGRCGVIFYAVAK
jgi:hypothetical protein